MIMCSGGVLNLVLEHLGRAWETMRPEDIRSDIDKIRMLREVNTAVLASGDLESLRRDSPTFCEVYSNVMLRDIEESIPDGCQS